MDIIIERKCEMCGGEIENAKPMQRFCEHCAYERKMASHRKWAATHTAKSRAEKRAERNAKVQRGNTSIAEANRIAREHGLSYGQAVARGLI